MIYYSFVGVKYYKEEFKYLCSGGKLPKKAKTPIQGKPKNSFKEDKAFEELELFVKDLRYAVMDRAGREADKQELLARFKDRVGNYAGIQRPAYRKAINDFIIINAKDINGVVFSEDELNAAWDALPVKHRHQE